MKQTKRILCTVLSLALIVCACAAPVSAADEDWKAAYRTVISKNAEEWGNVYQLADLNLDGTPELLIGGMPGSGLFSVIQNAFTFRDGAASEISVSDEYLKLGDEYALYRNNSTGAVRIEGKYVLRAGAGSSMSVTANYICDGSVLSYESTFASGEDGGSKVYYVGNDKVSAGSYNSAYNSRNDGWTQLDFPVAVVTVSGKPGSSETNSFLNSYTGGAALAVPSAHNIQVNGEPVSIGAYGIGGNNYFKLRDLAMLLKDTESKFQVGWDGAKNQITLTTGEVYTPTGTELAAGGTASNVGTVMSSALIVDGRSVDLTAYNISGNNYFKLRDLGEVLGFDVGWNESSSTVSIDTAP